MLDSETKKRIDDARNMLVGKVPDPKAQVEQITIALIYKFMDDMDAESEELGGKRKFFTGDFAQYGWAKLMHPGLGGHEILKLYAEGIAKIPENPAIPSLFRDIFKNAFLPYRDPETLKSFLKIINEFTYDHSERLGDAFEYLLSVLGAQGDAGQFRTPRHIIDFMIQVVDPKKDETILDPACGTAGFLISSYKHILKANTDKKGNSKLTPDEKGRLAQNFKGYDISPDMVRLSLVNLYLHGFSAPSIDEYDTLTSEDKWDELADVVLANPPFMSPKGGIKPHKGFSVQSKRSEVLFVDYMAEHLTPKGRAAIIVPEGIIFQSQNVYKQLRKMLVESYLVAVVSLPAGVFNPYSGVKTSILIFDKSLAKQSETIGFFKIENDGYGLGAQRRPIDKDNLPQALEEITGYLALLRSGEPFDDFKPTLGLITLKEKIAENGEYNLSGERYRESIISTNHTWPITKLSKLCTIVRGASPRPIKKFITNSSNGLNWIKIGDADKNSKHITNVKEKITPEGAAKSRKVEKGDFILSNSMSFGRPYIMAIDGYIHDGWLLIKENEELINKLFLYNILKSKPVIEQFKRSATGGVVNNLNSELVRNASFPLPPLEVQKEIVAEIEGYQKVIDGARAVVDNYRPHIAINPAWPVMELEGVCDIKRGKFSHRPRNEPRFYGGEYPFIQTGDVVKAFGRKVEYTQTLNEEGLSVSKLFKPPIVVITIAANIGDTAVLDYPACFPDSVVALTPFSTIDVYFLELMMRTKKQHLNNIAPQAAQKNINVEILKSVEISLPPLEVQQAIVAEIEAEQALVNSNQELIDRFEKKIQATIARVWGEEDVVTDVQ
jgi:type I restriction enzyme M protein